MAGDTASEGRRGGCQAGAGTLQASWAFVPLRVDRLAPSTAFVHKAPGSLFCALKIHIKSIFAASLVFLPDTVSPPLGHSWGFRTGEGITDGCPHARMWLRNRC